MILFLIRWPCKTYEVDPYSVEIYRLRQGFRKLSSDRQTYRHDENYIPRRFARVVKNPRGLTVNLRRRIIRRRRQIVIIGMARQLVSGYLLSWRKLNYAQMSSDTVECWWRIRHASLVSPLTHYGTFTLNAHRSEGDYCNVSSWRKCECYIGYTRSERACKLNARSVACDWYI